MAHLLIIGNGFDLAHGLETGYQSFVEKVTKQILDEGSESQSLLRKVNNSWVKEVNEVLKYIKQNGRNEMINNKYQGYFKNHFFSEIYASLAENWCDLEQLYFDNLITTHNAKFLNEQFETVKKYLGQYLSTEEKRCSIIEEYKYLIDKVLKLPYTRILNFNYTSTVKKYVPELGQKNKLYPIHGELDSIDNPIVFGYAPSEIETVNLLAKNDNEYLRNIKEYCYSRTGYYQKFRNFLEEINKGKKKLDVTIVGHSCYNSDALILSELFKHDCVKKIRVLYHNDYENYFQIRANITRIIGNRQLYLNKLLDMNLCHPMPQHNWDEKMKESFKKYVDSNYYLDPPKGPSAQYA